MQGNKLTISIIRNAQDLIEIVKALTPLIYHPEGHVKRLFNFKAELDHEPTELEKQNLHELAIVWKSPTSDSSHYHPPYKPWFKVPTDRPLSDVEQYFAWKEKLNESGEYWGDCSDVW